jgi:hypothetical protein
MAFSRQILVPIFAERGASRGQRGGTPTAVNLSFLDQSRHYFFFQVAPHLCSEAEWTLFQTHQYSGNLVAPEIEPGTTESAARNSDHLTTKDKVYNNLYFF